MDRIEFDQKALEIKDCYRKLESLSISEIPYDSIRYRSPMNNIYFKVNAIGNCWDEKQVSICESISAIFMGLHAVNIPFSMIVKSEGTYVEIYYGFHYEKGHEDEVLRGLMTATLPALEIESALLPTFDDIIKKDEYVYGGFVKGNPSARENGSSIDLIINGMGKKKWCFVINARPIARKKTIEHQGVFLNVASGVSELLDVSFSDTNNSENTSSKKVYYEASKFSEKTEGFCEKYSEALNVGEWTVTLQYAAKNESDARLLSGLLVSLFYGENSKPEVPRSIYCQNYKISQTIIDDCESDIIAGFEYPKVSSFLTSNELAIYASLPTVDTAGFAVKSHVDFDVARDKSGPLSFGQILKNGMLTNSEYSLNYNELNRHCLIVGLTGSGKTNTTKNILHNVYEGSDHTLPIMVIEPAKKEYWELYKLGFEDLQIYTVGSSDPLCNPYCLNPFERIGNTALQTHIDNVYAAFKASFIMYTPMPYVLERAIYEIYEDYGWDIKTNTNTKGTNLYPTIEDLYWKIPVVVTAMGYDQKMRNDLIGSLQARINSLRLGSKGDTLNVKKSFPIGEILEKNVVIELEDIGDDDVKAFIISMLLIQLVELRRQQEDCQLEVKHLLLIEEAHRLLKNVQSGSGENADPRGAAVEFFCNLLAELRSKGQGFIIADQIPSKLAPDLIKNTNIKIVHRTVDKEDRELMGGAMHMTEEQTDYLSSLKMGEAAIYSEGDNRPKLMKPNFAGSHITANKTHLKTERQVLELTKKNCYLVNNNPDYTSLTGRNLVCRLCKPYCDKTPEQIFEFIDVKKLEDLMSLNQVAPNGKITTEVLNAKFDEVLSGTNISDKAERKHAKGCMLCHMLKQWNLSDKINENIIKTLFGN